MKVFKCTSVGIYDRIPLEFGNLKEIEFRCKDLADHWINIMMQNRKLRKVTIIKDTNINGLGRDHLKRIAEGLPNLDVFTMQFAVQAVEEIHDFLQSASQLKNATFWWIGEGKCNEGLGKWATVHQKYGQLFFCSQEQSSFLSTSQ